MMTDSDLIFLDTAPLIYFLDRDAEFYTYVYDLFERVMNSNICLVTSVISCMEYSVKPYRQGEIEKINALYELLDDLDAAVLAIDGQTARRAAMIRAEYTAFKALDSLQLACACMSGCDIFLTNDAALRGFQNMTCVMVKDIHDMKGWSI